MSKRARRETGGPSRKSRPASFIDPRTEFGIAWRQAFWAGDPQLGVADGGSVSVWRPSGAVRGAYLDGSGLVLPAAGGAGCGAYVPDEAALDVGPTGLVLTFDGTLSDWSRGTEPTLIAKQGTTAGANPNNRAFMLSLNSTGALKFYWWEATALKSQTSTANVPFADGARGRVAVSFHPAPGGAASETKFWTSTDGVTWAQLGATRTGAAASSVDATSAPVWVAADVDGYDSRATVHGIRIYSDNGFGTSGPTGTKVLDVDFARTNTGGFTASTGQNVVINSAPWGAHLDTARGMVLPGTAGNYASVPDSAALSITGDITLVAKATLTDWTPAPSNTLIGKWYGLGDSYLLRVSATQVLLNTSPDGTTSVTHGSTVAAPFSDGASGWIAASIDVDDGAGNRVVKFWTSTDGVTWTQLGATVTTAGATSIYDSSSSLEIGAYGLGATSPATGSIQVARVYSGSGFSAAGPSGTLVFDADFRRDDCPSFTASTGQTVTINSTFNAAQATVGSRPTYRAATAAFGNRPTVQFDGGDYLASGAGAAQSQPISVVVIGQATTLGGAGAVSLFCDGISAARMALGYYQTGSKVRVIGTAALDLNGADTNPHLLTAVFNGASSEIRMDGTSLGTGTTGTATTPTAMTIGASYSGGANPLTGHIAFVGWYVGDITAHANWTRFKAWVREHYGITVT